MDLHNQYGLIESEQDQLITVLSSNVKIEKLVLFGSRAKGTFENGSDIDLALFGDELKLDDILNASILIDNLQLPYQVDLVIYDRIKEQKLKDHINRVGVILYQKNTSNR